MSAQEIIEQIKELPAIERAQVARFVREASSARAPRSSTVVVLNGPDGLPLIRASEGVITSQLVNEIEGLAP